MNAVFGLYACAVLVGFVVGRLPAGPLDRRLLAGAAFALALLPVIDGASAAAWLRALVGTPSVTLTVLALLSAAGVRARALPTSALAATTAIALVFYPLALGLTPFDPYRLGFQPALLLAAAPVALLLWKWRLDVWLLILALGVGAFAAGLTANLWDALLDPLLAIAAGIALVRRLNARSADHRESP